MCTADTALIHDITSSIWKMCGQDLNNELKLF